MNGDTLIKESTAYNQALQPFVNFYQCLEMNKDKLKMLQE